MTLGVGAGTLVAGAIVGAYGTSMVMWIVLGASALTALLSLIALPSRSTGSLSSTTRRAP
jgi:hypothetical protein